MPARPTAPTTRQTTRSVTPNPAKSAAPVTLPPVVAALAALFDVGEGGRIDDDFLAAWQMAPALIAQAMSGEGMSNRGTTRFDLIEQRMTEAVTRGQSSEWDHERRMAAIVEALDRTDPDALTDIRSTIGDAAFFTGLACGLYLLTNSAPLPLGGVR